MKRTLLELTQELLSAMESDEVNSINDTVESYSVALLLKGVYYDCATELGLHSHDNLFELNASGDSEKPTLMTVPSNVIRTDWIEYDIKTSTESYSNYRRLDYMQLDQFLAMQNALSTQGDVVGEMVVSSNGENFNVMYRNDKEPRYYTSYDDYNIIFDSYDATEDTTLQKSKTRCYGSVYPTFTLADTFTPDLEPQQFAFYYNRAKVRAFAELKQVANSEAAKETRNQKIILQKHRRVLNDVPPILKVARYGRSAPMTAIPTNLKQGD